MPAAPAAPDDLRGRIVRHGPLVAYVRHSGRAQLARSLAAAERLAGADGHEGREPVAVDAATWRRLAEIATAR